METYGIFRNGQWIEYKLSVTAQEDPRWTEAEKWLAASVFATAKTKGFSNEKAYQLSDAVVFQTIYKDLEYSEALQKEIVALKNHVGKA